MGAKSRRKGKSGELEAAGELRRLFGVDARRGRQYQGTDESPDVMTGIEGLHVEVKRTEKLRAYEAIRQAAEQCGTDVPVVLHRANRREWLAIVRLEDLPRLAWVLRQ